MAFYLSGNNLKSSNTNNDIDILLDYTNDGFQT